MTFQWFWAVKLAVVHPEISLLFITQLILNCQLYARKTPSKRLWEERIAAKRVVQVFNFCARSAFKPQRKALIFSMLKFKILKIRTILTFFLNTIIVFYWLSASCKFAHCAQHRINRKFMADNQLVIVQKGWATTSWPAGAAVRLCAYTPWPYPRGRYSPQSLMRRAVKFLAFVP